MKNNFNKGLELQLLQDVPLEDRETTISSMAYGISENEMISRQLTEEEIQTHKQSLFEVDVEIDEMEESFKEVKKAHKESMKSIRRARAEHIRALRYRSYSEKGTLYLIDDQESGMMGYYDGNGVLVSSRPLKPEERQLSILTQVAK
jgi:hypothetical protein